MRGELPPKKGGVNSMWDKPLEMKRLIALRRAARTAMAGRPSFEGLLTLKVHIRVPEDHLQRADDLDAFSDLDDFSTGIRDGLMAAHGKAFLSFDWNTLANADIAPGHVTVFTDDARIVKIEASLTASPDGSIGYEVEVEQVG